MNLKMATYNIYHGFHKAEVADSVFALANHGVELFCLQEVCADSIADLLLERLGPDWRKETFNRKGSYSLGLCILWKAEVLRLVHIQHYLLPKLPRFTLFEWIFERKIMPFIKRPLQRGALVATFEIGQKRLRVTDLHLDWHGHIEQRARQLTFIAQHLKTPVDYEIVCGDFNTVGLAPFSGPQEHRMREILGPGFVNALPGTEHTTNIYEHLDYVFTKGVKVKTAEVMHLAGSDHFPLKVNLEL